MTSNVFLAALASRRVHILYSAVVAMFAVLISLAWALPANAANVTAATGTVTDPDGNGVSGVQVELHNSDSSVSYNDTTDVNGDYSITGDDTQMNGEQMTIEFTAPDGYNRPSNVPHIFTYSTGQDAENVDFTLVLAPKTITVNVVDEKGSGVDRFDVYAVPLSGTGQGVNSQIEGSTGSLDVTGGDWAVSIDRNLSETNPSRYPWVAIGGAQTVEFAVNDNTESVELDFEVIGASEARLTRVKMVNASSEILVGNSFNGDVTFNGFTKHGVVSTQAKVDSSTGVASLYLLPGIYKIDAYHNSQLQNQSYDPTERYVVTEGETELDLGTIAATNNTASITGTLTVVTSNKSGAFSKQNSGSVNLSATNTDSGRVVTAQTNTDGTFTIPNLGAGNYSITPSDEGYITLRSSNVEVAAGEAVTGVTLRMARSEVTISGTVQNNGTAVQDARAVIVGKAGGQTFSAPVDPDTGAYSMKVYQTGDNTVELDVVTQVSSEIFQTESTTVNIKGETSVTKNIAVSTNEGTISGTVVDFASNGTVTAALGDNAEVTAIHQATGSVEKTTVNDNGTFSMNVGQGNWKVLIDINDVDATAIAGVATDQKVAVSAGAATSGVNVPVHVGDDGTVSGTLVDLDGNAVAEARVLITNQPQLEETADAKKGRKVNPEAIVSVVTETNTSGAFSQGLPNGTYTAFYSDNPSDSTEIAPKGREFTISNENVSLGQVAYRTGSTTVSGTIDSKLKDASLVFTAEDGTTVQANISGKTYTASLPEGTYSATVSGVKGNKVTYDEKQVKVASSDKTVNFKKLVKSDVPVPAAAQASCESGESCVVSNTAGAQVRLAPYAASLTEDVTVSLVPKVSIDNSAGYDQVGVMYEVDIRDSSGFAITQLEQPADITLPIDKKLYDDAVSTDELTPSFKQDDLNMFLADGVQATVGKNSMTIKTEHLTPFAITTADTGVAKPKKARKLKAVKVRKKKATMRWQRPKNTKNITRYRVQLRKFKVKKKTKWTKANKKKKLQNTYVKRKAKKLKPGTKYQFRVKAFNSAGKSKWSKWKKFKTKAL